MADLSDVEQAILAVIVQVVYPNGTGNSSVVGTRCDIYRGWPIPADLDQDLAAGTVNISIFPMDNEQKTTRYPREWQTASLPTVALTLTVSGDTITVGGTPSSPLNAAAIVDGATYVYPVQPGDTLTDIATGLSALIAYTTEDGAGPYGDESSNPYSSATSSGPVITIPGAHRILARVGGFGDIIRETKRQKRGFMITFWCPDPATRDLIVGPVDAALADIDFLSLPDGAAGRLIYEKSRVSDRVEREGLYRRDLFYSVEYGTTDTQGAAQIIAEILAIADGIDPAAPAVTTITI